MGFDWETILGAEGEDLARAYEDHVGPVETERWSAFDYDYYDRYREPDIYVDSEDDCTDPVDLRAYSGPKVKVIETRKHISKRISKRISGTPRRKDGRKGSS